MDLLHILTLTGLLGIALCYRCHVSNDSSALGCGSLKNMSCSNLQYTPYCHQIPGDTSNLNGICTCEQFCLDNSDCTKGCPNANEHFVCADAYPNSLERICLCKSTSPNPVG